MTTKIIYAPVDESVHDRLVNLARRAQLSQRVTVEALLSHFLGLPHPHAATLVQIRDEIGAEIAAKTKRSKR